MGVLSSSSFMKLHSIDIILKTRSRSQLFHSLQMVRFSIAVLMALHAIVVFEILILLMAKYKIVVFITGRISYSIFIS